MDFVQTKYLDSTEEYAEKEGLYTGDDFTNDRICRELDAATVEVSPKIARTIFGYDKRRKALRCPTCLERRAGDDEWRFAQAQKDKTIKCAACLSVYTSDEYEKKIVEYFGYLGRGRASQNR